MVSQVVGCESERCEMNVSWVTVPLIYVGSIFAQVDTGTISGVVQDKSAGVVPGAVIRILQLDTNTQHQLVTNEAGFYSAPALRPGLYEISVLKDGFRPQKSPPIQVRVQD